MVSQYSLHVERLTEISDRAVHLTMEHVQYNLASSSTAGQEMQFGHLEVALNLNGFLLGPWQQLEAVLSPFVLGKILRQHIA